MLMSVMNDILSPPALPPPVLSSARAKDPKLGALYTDLTPYMRLLSETPHLTYPAHPVAPTLHSSSKNQDWPLLAPPGWSGGDSYIDWRRPCQTVPPDWFRLEDRILPSGPVIWWSAPPATAYVRSSDITPSTNVPLLRWDFPAAGPPEDVFVRWVQLMRRPCHNAQTLNGDHGWLYDTPLTPKHNPALMVLEISLPAPYAWPARTVIADNDFAYQPGSSAYNQHVTFEYTSSSHFDTAQSDGPWEMAMALGDLAVPCSPRNLLSFSRDLWWKISARIGTCHTNDYSGGPCAVVTGGNLHSLISRLWRAGWHPHAKCDTARISL